MILYRPVGEKEFELIKQGGFEKFPPRLPIQPIFYPVLTVDYAREIASKWNTIDKNSSYRGYVLQFEVSDAFISRYEVQTVGGKRFQEFWIPADDLEELNSNIIGEIIVLEKYE